MVFGGVVVGFARILVAEGVPLIVAGMVELKGSLCSSAPKSFRRTEEEVCSSFTVSHNVTVPELRCRVCRVQVTFTQHTNTHRPNSKA